MMKPGSLAIFFVLSLGFAFMVFPDHAHSQTGVDLKLPVNVQESKEVNVNEPFELVVDWNGSTGYDIVVSIFQEPWN